MRNEKSKLLVTASTFPRWDGDTEPRFVLDLSKALLKYFDVTVLVPACPGAKDEEVLEGIKVIRYHYFPLHRIETLCYPGAIVPRIKEKRIRVLLVPFLFLGLWLKLIKVIPEYDIVHAHWLLPQGIVQSFFKKPYIVTGHGGDVTSLNKGLFRRLKIRTIKKAKCVTVVSKALEKEILKLAPVSELTVKPMGCNVFEFSSEYRIDNFFNQEDKKVILFVGRLAEIKGVTYLIEAVKNLDVLLIIVGTGNLLSELKKQAQGMGEKIKFLGPKTHEELKIIYASSDIFVAPSITAAGGGKEGFGLVFLEAMASGLPVIGSNSGGIPDIIEDGKNGFLTAEKSPDQIADRIQRLISDKKLYDEMVINARKTAENYDYSQIAICYKELLEKARTD